MNKLTLLVDMNWLLMSRMPMFVEGFKSESPDIKLQAQSELEELMARSINVVLNRFPMIDNIVLVSDGGSWRKQLPIPESLKNITYKGNRIQDHQLDWSYIYKALNNVVDNAKSLGITTSNHRDLEGDDWIWYWTRRLNAENINCMIWSSDNDLKQLIQVDSKTNAFTIWYNDRNGLWLPDSIKQPDDVIDFFMQFEYFSPLLESIKKASPEHYINPNTIITSKIICGDSGDNIKSIFRYTKGNKVFRITESAWDSMSKSLNINDIRDLVEHKADIASSIASNTKYQPYHPDVDQLLEMLEYNIKLVWLNEEIIPDTAIQAMNQCEYKSFDVSYIRSNYKQLLKQDDYLQTLFEDAF